MDSRDRQETLEGLVDTLHAHLADRWADVWLLPQEHSSTLHVAVVDPTPADVRFASDQAREAGWLVTVVGVRHSKVELEGFVDRIVDLMTSHGAIISCGFSPSENAVVIELTRLDDDVVAKALELAPSDALSFQVNLGAGYRTL